MHPKRCTVVQGCLGLSYNLPCLGVGVCMGSCRFSVSCGVGSGVSILMVGALAGMFATKGVTLVVVGQPVQTLLVQQLTKFVGEVPSLGNTNPAPPVVHA